MIEPSFLALLVRRELVDQLYGFAHFKGHSRPADPAIASRVETGKISPFRKKKNIKYVHKNWKISSQKISI